MFFFMTEPWEELLVPAVPHSQSGRYGHETNTDSLAAQPVTELLLFK